MTAAPDQTNQPQLALAPQQSAPSAIMGASLSNDLVVRPRNMGELIEYAKMIAYSGMVPKDYVGNPGACIVAMQMGAELGLSPLAALANIAVINGRPSLWGDVGLALIKTHRDFVKIVETRTDTSARCVLSRRNEPDVTHDFSIDDAKEAKLWGKAGPWQTSPMRMLQMRARWFAMRDQFPDVLRGLSAVEEVIDMPGPYPAPIGAVAPMPPDAPVTTKDANPKVLEVVHHFEAIGVSVVMLETKFGDLSLVPLEHFQAVYREIKQNPKRKAEMFGASPSAAADINKRFAAPAREPGDDFPEPDEAAIAAGAAEAEARS